MRISPSSYSVEVVHAIAPEKYTFEHNHIGSPLPTFLGGGTAHCMKMCLARMFVNITCGCYTRYESVGGGGGRCTN